MQAWAGTPLDLTLTKSTSRRVAGLYRRRHFTLSLQIPGRAGKKELLRRLWPCGTIQAFRVVARRDHLEPYRALLTSASRSGPAARWLFKSQEYRTIERTWWLSELVKCMKVELTRIVLGGGGCRLAASLASQHKDGAGNSVLPKNTAASHLPVSRIYVTARKHTLVCVFDVIARCVLTWAEFLDEESATPSSF
jgi:hypothetical protein